MISVLTESVDAQAYWRKLKQRLREEGNETVTNCHGLKMVAADGKMRLTDVADTEQLFTPNSNLGENRQESGESAFSEKNIGKPKTQRN